MDMRGAKNSKTARKKLRKKLLESGIKVDSSTVSCLSSDVTLMNENSMKELTENEKQKLSRKKRKDTNTSETDLAKVYQLGSQHKAVSKKPKSEKSLKSNQEKKKRKLSQKNREKLKVNEPDVDGIDQLDTEGEDGSEKPDSEKLIEGKVEKVKNRRLRKDRLKQKVSGVDVTGIEQLDAECEDKSERSNKKKKEDKILSGKVGEAIKENTKSGASEVYHISSVDADSSKGMKKWINEYYQHRPGLKILQQRIDEFITTHEENEEQARKDKEALAAEGGWTVVVHQKGRKKTTDAESGTAVGSVAQAAVVGHRSEKKIKDFGVDFYRFQKREAQRNEIMVLQNKFEEDKKRIQQLRSARKFRPY